jgi:hypothetical protein
VIVAVHVNGNATVDVIASEGSGIDHAHGTDRVHR